MNTKEIVKKSVWIAMEYYEKNHVEAFFDIHLLWGLSFVLLLYSICSLNTGSYHLIRGRIFVISIDSSAIRIPSATDISSPGWRFK